MSINRISIAIKQFFARCARVRPVIWIGLYVAVVPIFALLYWTLPDAQFRIPDNAPTDYGSWLYYSIVTITTLGFGDYTPAHSGAQAITAIEVMCGLIFLGFFLNAVGSLKSEIAVESELEKQKKLHQAAEKNKLIKTTPLVLHQLNLFMAVCYAVTSPLKERKTSGGTYNSQFTLADMVGMFTPSGLPFDHSSAPAVALLLKCADRTSLLLDNLQNKIDLTLWPELLEDCFTFVAQWQIFSATDNINTWIKHVTENPATEAKIIQQLTQSINTQTSEQSATPKSLPADLRPVEEISNFIRNAAQLSLKIETQLTTAASIPSQEQ